MRTWTYVLAATLSGCIFHPHTSSRIVTGPGGAPAVSVTCSRDRADCYDEATSNCPGGYVALSETTESLLFQCSAPVAQGR